MTTTTLTVGTKTTLSRRVYGRNIHGITHQEYSRGWYDAGTPAIVESDRRVALAYPTVNVFGEDNPPEIAVLIDGFRVIVPLDAVAEVSA